MANKKGGRGSREWTDADRKRHSQLLRTKNKLYESVKAGEPVHLNTQVGQLREALSKMAVDDSAEIVVKLVLDAEDAEFGIHQHMQGGEVIQEFQMILPIHL